MLAFRLEIYIFVRLFAPAFAGAFLFLLLIVSMFNRILNWGAVNIGLRFRKMLSLNIIQIAMLGPP